jgi:hypothetical protein
MRPQTIAIRAYKLANIFVAYSKFLEQCNQEFLIQ